MQFRTPQEALRYHVSGAIARGEAKPIVEISPDSEAGKTIRLQAQFICPIWAVWHGMNGFKSVSVYFTNYHAEQMVRALTLNGTPVVCFDGKGRAL